MKVATRKGALTRSLHSQHPDVGLLASRTMRKQLSAVQDTQSVLVMAAEQTDMNRVRLFSLSFL